MLSILVSISYLVHLMYSIIFFFSWMVLNSSVQFQVLLIWGIWHFKGNPLWSVGLTASVFPEPVWAIPTMSWPLRATGKPWAWIAVGSLKFCCIRTSITYSVTIKSGVLTHFSSQLILIFIYLIIATQSRCVPTHGETVHGERRWQALNSHCL